MYNDKKAEPSQMAESVARSQNSGIQVSLYSKCYETIMFGRVIYAWRRYKERALSVYLIDIL